MPKPARKATAALDLFSDPALAPVPAHPVADANAEPRPAPDPKTQRAAPVAAPPTASAYSAKDIEVLEGLEPVRRRPGMYIGGTDERALHHLFAEVLDNAMDEAVALHAKIIEVSLDAEGALSVRDDGRGIPVDPHPKHPGKSALEVILTVLHSGGKFSGKAYETSGGLHGVGVSVVNALSDRLDVNVWRDGFEWRQAFSRGHPQGAIEKLGPSRKHGTLVRFTPDPDIFGEDVAFKPARLFRMARAKAYLFRGVEIRWKCAPERLHDATPGRGRLPLPQRPGRLPEGACRRHRDRHPRTLRRPHRARRRGRRCGMGGGVEPRGLRRGRWLHPVLLQHRADAGGRHA